MIRRATPDDAPGIAAVEVRTFRHAYADILDPQFLADLEELAHDLFAPELLSAAGIGAERTVFDAALEPLGAVA